MLNISIILSHRI